MTAPLISLSPELYAKVKETLHRRCAAEHPAMAATIDTRVWVVEHGTFIFPRREDAVVLEGLPLYSRLVKARLRAFSGPHPNWKLALQLSRWIQMMELSAEGEPR